MATTQLTASGVLNELVGAARLEKISVTCRLDPGDLTINGKSAIKPTFDTNNGDVALLRIWPKGDTTSVTELTLTNSQYADFENNNEYLIPNLIAGTTYKVSLFIMYNSDIVDADDNTTVLDQAPVGFEKTTEVMPYTVANIKSGTTSDSSTGLDNFFTTGALDSIMLKLPGSFDNYFTDKTVYNGYDPLTSITVLLVDSASDSGDNTIVNTYGKDDLKDGITSPNLQFTISDDVDMSTDYEIFITVTNSATAENGAAITSVGSVSTKIASNPASVTVDKVSGNNGDLTISFQIANELLNGRSATYSLTDSDLYSVNTTFEIYGTENYTDTMDTILNNPLFTTVVKHPTEPSGTEPNLALSDNNDPDSITISFSNTNQASVVLGGNSGASASEKKTLTSSSTPSLQTNGLIGNDLRKLVVKVFHSVQTTNSAQVLDGQFIQFPVLLLPLDGEETSSPADFTVTIENENPILKVSLPSDASWAADLETSLQVGGTNYTEISDTPNFGMEPILQQVSSSMKSILVKVSDGATLPDPNLYAFADGSSVWDNVAAITLTNNPEPFSKVFTIQNSATGALSQPSDLTNVEGSKCLIITRTEVSIGYGETWTNNFAMVMVHPTTPSFDQITVETKKVSGITHETTTVTIPKNMLNGIDSETWIQNNLDYVRLVSVDYNIREEMSARRKDDPSLDLTVDGTLVTNATDIGSELTYTNETPPSASAPFGVVGVTRKLSVQFRNSDSDGNLITGAGAWGNGIELESAMTTAEFVHKWTNNSPVLSSIGPSPEVSAVKTVKQVWNDDFNSGTLYNKMTTLLEKVNEYDGASGIYTTLNSKLDSLNSSESDNDFETTSFYPTPSGSNTIAAYKNTYVSSREATIQKVRTKSITTGEKAGFLVTLTKTQIGKHSVTPESDTVVLKFDTGRYARYIAAEGAAGRSGTDFYNNIFDNKVAFTPSIFGVNLNTKEKAALGEYFYFVNKTTENGVDYDDYYFILPGDSQNVGVVKKNCCYKISWQYYSVDARLQDESAGSATAGNDPRKEAIKLWSNDAYVPVHPNIFGIPSSTLELNGLETTIVYNKDANNNTVSIPKYENSSAKAPGILFTHTVENSYVGKVKFYRGTNVSDDNNIFSEIDIQSGNDSDRTAFRSGSVERGPPRTTIGNYQIFTMKIEYFSACPYEDQFLSSSSILFIPTPLTDWGLENNTIELKTKNNNKTEIKFSLKDLYAEYSSGSYDSAMKQYQYQIEYFSGGSSQGNVVIEENGNSNVYNNITKTFDGDVKEIMVEVSVFNTITQLAPFKPRKYIIQNVVPHSVSNITTQGLQGVEDELSKSTWDYGGASGTGAWKYEYLSLSFTEPAWKNAAFAYQYQLLMKDSANSITIYPVTYNSTADYAQIIPLELAARVGGENSDVVLQIKTEITDMGSDSNVISANYSGFLTNSPFTVTRPQDDDNLDDVNAFTPDSNSATKAVVYPTSTAAATNHPPVNTVGMADFKNVYGVILFTLPYVALGDSATDTNANQLFESDGTTPVTGSNELGDNPNNLLGVIVEKVPANGGKKVPMPGLTVYQKTTNTTSNLSVDWEPYYDRGLSSSQAPIVKTSKDGELNHMPGETLPAGLENGFINVLNEGYKGEDGQLEQSAGNAATYTSSRRYGIYFTPDDINNNDYIIITAVYSQYDNTRASESINRYLSVPVAYKIESLATPPRMDAPAISMIRQSNDNMIQLTYPAQAVSDANGTYGDPKILTLTHFPPGKQNVKPIQYNFRAIALLPRNSGVLNAFVFTNETSMRSATGNYYEATANQLTNNSLIPGLIWSILTQDEDYDGNVISLANLPAYTTCSCINFFKLLTPLPNSTQLDYQNDFDPTDNSNPSFHVHNISALYDLFTLYNLEDVIFDMVVANNNNTIPTNWVSAGINSYLEIPNITELITEFVIDKGFASLDEAGLNASYVIHRRPSVYTTRDVFTAFMQSAGGGTGLQNNDKATLVNKWAATGVTTTWKNREKVVMEEIAKLSKKNKLQLFTLLAIETGNFSDSLTFSTSYETTETLGTQNSFFVEGELYGINVFAQGMKISAGSGQKAQISPIGLQDEFYTGIPSVFDFHHLPTFNVSINDVDEKLLLSIATVEPRPTSSIASIQLKHTNLSNNQDLMVLADLTLNNNAIDIRNTNTSVLDFAANYNTTFVNNESLNDPKLLVIPLSMPDFNNPNKTYSDVEVILNYHSANCLENPGKVAVIDETFGSKMSASDLILNVSTNRKILKIVNSSSVLVREFVLIIKIDGADDEAVTVLPLLSTKSLNPNIFTDLNSNYVIVPNDYSMTITVNNSGNNVLNIDITNKIESLFGAGSDAIIESATIFASNTYGMTPAINLGSTETYAEFNNQLQYA